MESIMKNLCVFGCLLSNNGKKIKEQMLSWLKTEYNVFCVDQNPPGNLFEYPAIKYAIKLSIDMNEPVLYLHTKGAAHDTDLNKKVRKIWFNEFIKNKNSYFNNDINNEIITPFTGLTRKRTWFNGFVIYPSAALKLNKTLLQTEDRYYYERLCWYNSDIVLKGIINDKLEYSVDVINYIDNMDLK